MPTFREYVVSDSMKALIGSLDVNVRKMHAIARSGLDSGILTRAERLEFDSHRREAIDLAIKIDDEYEEWRNLFGFQSDYAALHHALAYLSRSDSRRFVPADLTDVISEREHRRAWRKSETRLGLIRRKLNELPEPYTGQSGLSDVLSRLEDLSAVAKRRRSVAKSCDRALVCLRSISYAIAGSHDNETGSFSLRQAIAVATIVRRRSARRQ